MKDKDLVELINDVDDLETAKQISVELAKACEKLVNYTNCIGGIGANGEEWKVELRSAESIIAEQALSKCRELLGEK